MKIDLRFTLDSENEEHKKALHVYNSLRRKYRVDFFVELTKPYWDKDLVNYPNVPGLDVERKLVSSKEDDSSLKSEAAIATSKNFQTQDASSSKNDVEIPKKRNPLLG